MDLCAHKILESATQKTLHSQGFSRASSQASSVLTDLLARYLVLLSASCAKYANHAGRTAINPRDAIMALKELGVELDELQDFYSGEGTELARYAILSGRRVEDLHELKAHLSDGLRPDRDDTTDLVYAPISDAMFSDESEEEEEQESELEVHPQINGHVSSVEDMDVEGAAVLETRPSPRHNGKGKGKERASPPRQMSPPPLPLSPVSNPSSPARKRPRTAAWKPPEYIPDHLPPFPNPVDSDGLPLTPDQTQPTSQEHTMLPPLSLPPAHSSSAGLDRTPQDPLPSITTSGSPADYLSPTPYSQSSLANVPEWHLPSKRPPAVPPSLSAHPSRQRLPTPQTQPSLFAAYHHILTHPPPPRPPPAHPSRHKVALALLNGHPRWDTPDTLFGSVAPGAPRVSSFGPTHALPIMSKDDLEKDKKLPPLPNAPPRSIASNERVVPLISQQPSRIPELARAVLPGTIHNRTTRLGHPPVLIAGEKKLTYGPGVNAPWNASAQGADDDDATDRKGERVLPDARMYATWEYEAKSFREPLPARRGRMASFSGSPVVPQSAGFGNGTGGSGLVLSLGGRGERGG